MTSSLSKRDRASSDRDEQLVSRRPPLQNRAISAPAGELYKLFPITADAGHNRPRDTAIEEEDAATPAVGNSTIIDEKPDLPCITIAIVGSDSAGRTAFITTALGLNSSFRPRSAVKMLANGLACSVRLLEMPLESVAADSAGNVRFGADPIPLVDGVLILHNPAKLATFDKISRLLESLSASATPYVVAVNNADTLSLGTEDPILLNHEIYPMMSESTESQKRCLSWIIYAAAASKAGVFVGKIDPTLYWGGPIRAPPTSLIAKHQSYNHSHHIRASSESPAALTPSTTASGLNACRNGGALSPGQAYTTAASSFVDMVDMVNERDRPNGILTPEAPSSPGSQAKSSASTTSDAGFTLDELVDRLVSRPNLESASKSDSKFQSVFLCLYRKFAAPSSLLSSLIARFERNERTITDQLALNFDQSRILNVLGQWVRDYPGDFAHPRTRKRLADFVLVLERSPFYMFYAKEVSASFHLIEKDEDEGWPYGDSDVEGSNDGADIFLDHSGRSSPYLFMSSTTTVADDKEEEDPIYNMNSLDLSEMPSEISSSLPSFAVPDNPATILSQEYTLISLQAARKEAEGLEIVPRIPLTKAIWRMFMDFPDDEFSRMLTRIDWVMYSSFRPRDLVQHVSISSSERRNMKNLKHVNRLIQQFNHVATFVASMILMRDKPKHRARALEKFMNIAQKLRRLNNYNSLGALIAGIDGVPVHRLSQTRELIPQLMEKNFMQLEILMKSEKSHGPYRLAWDNTNSPRIPFLPLHRRDLVAAEEGNRTFLGSNKDRINWRKFKILGDVIILIQLSQQKPYEHLTQYPEMERLIQEIKLPSDETELYTRSMQVEPPAGGERKKFGFLRS